MKNRWTEPAKEACIYSKYNIIYKVDNKFLKLIGYKQDDIVGKSTRELSMLLKNNFQIGFNEMEGLHNLYIFNDEGLAIDVNVVCEFSMKENTKFYDIKENVQIFLRNMLLNFKNFSISHNQALAIYSYPDCICLKTNEKYINSLNSINIKGDDPIGKPYPYLRYLSKVIKEGSFYEDEVEFIGSNGIASYWDMSMRLITGDENKRYLMLSLYDVSNRVIERKLHDKKRVELEFVRCTYPELKIIDVNGNDFKSLKEINNEIKSMTSLIGKSYFAVYPADEEIKRKELDVNLNKKRLSSYLSYTNHIIDEEQRFFKTINQPIFGLNNKIVEIIFITIDITDEIKAKNKMEGILEIQNQMFTTISHELKTPLNAIFSSTQLIEMYIKKKTNKINKEDISKNINIIKQNCYRFTKLINNIVDLSSIESGFYGLNFSNRNIVEIVEDTVDWVRSYVEDRGLYIIFDTEIEEKVIAVDVEKIERIILNLISNAIKFSDKGKKIYININNKVDFIEILVRDCGSGIDKKYLETIFDKYRKIDNSLSRNAEGSGIGLTLVKTMVELIGGEISVESELGKGSLFTVRLPTKVLDESEVITTMEHSDSRIEQINIEFSDIYPK